MSNTGRRRIRPAWKATASRSSPPIARSATACRCASAGGFARQARRSEELEDWEGLNFDLIITLSPEAHHKALDLTRTMAADVEYWPTPDPTGMEGNREQKLAAYREVCDGLSMRIRRRFAKAGAASG